VATASDLARARLDFRVFLWIIWRHLGLPDPTERQYEIAEYLQNGPRRKTIMGFRGIGKSWITSAYVLWTLWRSPEMKILVVSASKERADAFSIFTKRLLNEVDFLSHLAPDPRLGDRDSNVAFDVRGCRPAHAPSVKSVGITGQIAGSRADLIVGDDVEVPNNSETATQREKLLSRVAELGGAVLTPESQNPEGGVTFLGTFQVEDSIYGKLEEKGYELRLWPSEMPNDADKYLGRLAPGIRDSGLEPGRATDPMRFDTFELEERRVEYGGSGYALQFMLDTSPADEDLHPLKIRDLIVHDLDVDVAPDYLVWSGGERECIQFLPNVGLFGDRFQGPMKVSEDFSPYQDTLMYVDPSGRGKDQTAYCVVKFLNSLVFLYDWGAFDGGYAKETLTKIAMLARDAKCNYIVVENNFGDGMYEQLLQPIVDKIVKFTRKDGDKVTGCKVEGHRAKGQKEIRAIDTLEPILSSHRMVIDTELAKRITKAKDRSHDVDAALKSGFYQMTRLTKARGCLKYDDWIDALSGACRWRVEMLGSDVYKEARERKAERLDAALVEFMEHAGGKKPGQATWSNNLTKEIV
jgi:hypothetical protein